MGPLPHHTSPAGSGASPGPVLRVGTTHVRLSTALPEKSTRPTLPPRPGSPDPSLTRTTLVVPGPPFSWQDTGEHCPPPQVSPLTRGWALPTHPPPATCPGLSGPLPAISPADGQAGSALLHSESGGEIPQPRFLGLVYVSGVWEAQGMWAPPRHPSSRLLPASSLPVVSRIYMLSALHVMAWPTWLSVSI